MSNEDSFGKLKEVTSHFYINSKNTIKKINSKNTLIFITLVLTIRFKKQTFNSRNDMIYAILHFILGTQYFLGSFIRTIGEKMIQQCGINQTFKT